MGSEAPRKCLEGAGDRRRTAKAALVPRPIMARQPHNTYVTATGDVEQLMPFQEFAQGSPVAQLASEDGDPVAARNSFSAVSSPADTVATATPKI